jgi:hypothetical protein
MAEELNCLVPSTLINRIPCLKCLSNNQLLGLLVYIWLERNNQGWPDGDTLTMEIVKERAACWACTGKKDKLIAMVNIWFDDVFSSREEQGDIQPEDVQEAVKCLHCESESTLMGMLLYLVCYYYVEPA